ncbi:MAG: ABC transporter ATP-binding protein [Pseudomonadota bacterium]
MSYIVEADRITKYFSPEVGPGMTFKHVFGRKDAVVALEDVSFTIKKGEIFGLIGPNGAGKTTLLKILATLILPSSGSVRVGGHEVAAESIAVRKCIGLVSGEERSFYWRISGRKNLEFFATFYNLTKKSARDRIDNLIELLEISSPDRMVGKYSSGMKQRLALARGLLHDPPVLLMDEPTKSLDPGSAEKIRKIVKEHLCLKEKKTIIWATHNLWEAETVCDRIGLINHGRLVAVGTMGELRGKAGLKQTASLEEIYKVMSQCV